MSAGRLLLTGASGFLGRHAAAALITTGLEVHAVGRSAPADADARWHAADLLEPGVAERLVRSIEPTHLLHLAWVATPGTLWSSTENVRWLEASLALLREFAAAGGRRAVVAGSCAEYDWAHGWCSEAVTPLRPATLYGRCKHALHVAASGLAEEVDLALAWARIFFAYGPGEHSDRLVPTLLARLLRGEEAAITEGSQIRDYLHGADVGAALSVILDSSICGPVNVASGRPTSVREIAATIGGLTERADLIRYGAIPTRLGDPPLIVGDVRRLTGELGFRPRFDLRTGLEDTVAAWSPA